MVDSADVFFYGLFMDMDLLCKHGLHPSVPRSAHLDGYELRIGDRATLVTNPKERTYGMVARLTHSEINTLYSDAGVADYRPVEVRVQIENDDLIPALCYNLPAEPSASRNVEYAHELLALAEKLAFPKQYLDKLRRLAQ